MTYFKKSCELTEEEIKQVSEMTGKIHLWLFEGRSIDYMAEKLHLEPYMVLNHMFETADDFNKKLGTKLYLKLWFHKRCWRRKR